MWARQTDAFLSPSNLKEHREDLRLTQQAFAEFASVSVASVKRAEQDRPGPTAVRRIARALGCPPEEVWPPQPLPAGAERLPYWWDSELFDTARDAVGCTVSELIESTGLCRRTIERARRPGYQPHARTQRALLAALGIGRPLVSRYAQGSCGAGSGSEQEKPERLLSELVGQVLSSERRRGLDLARTLSRRYGCLASLPDLEASELASQIKSAHASSLERARRVQAVVRAAVDLKIEELQIDEAFDRLRALPGIGPGRASRVLCDGYGVPEDEIPPVTRPQTGHGEGLPEIQTLELD